MSQTPASHFELRNRQLEVYSSEARFRVLAAGRRFGKTTLALLELLRATWAPNKKAWYVAPSYDLAKDLAWDFLKEMTESHWSKRPSESELCIYLRGGSTIQLKGADRPDSLRGRGLDFVVLDEYASMKEETWSKVIRPALSDRQGRALFIGTPAGCNHFYDRFEQAKNSPHWQAFQFTSAQGENIRDEELLDAQSDLDARTYAQEFEAAFNGAGDNRVYYTFEPKEHVKPLTYDPKVPLVWTLDFNIEPMCALLAQKVGETTHVLNEIVIPTNANTRDACEKFRELTKDLGKFGCVKVEVYGDASGNQRRTSGATTDWNIIREFFDSHKGKYLPVMKTEPSNPAIRDRINVVNGRLRNAAGDVRLLIDPKCCELIADLSKVSWEIDRSGRATGLLDKRDPLRTHTSDALGYYLTGVWGKKNGPPVGPRPDGRIIQGEFSRQ